MEYEETEENISKALTELGAMKNQIGSIGSSNEQMFTRLSNAVKVLCSRGAVQDRTNNLDVGFYDDSKTLVSKYIQGEESEELYNPGQNCTTFLLDHYGNSEQFALTLSMLFLSDKNIYCYPVKVRVITKNDLEDAEFYHYLNFVLFVDDDGTYISSCFVDLYKNITHSENFEEITDLLKDKYISDGENCIEIEMVGLSYFEKDIDLYKNFTIIQTLTDTYLIDFNYDAFLLDSTNAEFEKCGNITNYLDSREVSKCLKNYLK